MYHANDRNKTTEAKVTAITLLHWIREASQKIDRNAFNAFIGNLSGHHDYSDNNKLLIYLQKPAATQCASYATWKKDGYQVKRGEKGIKILVPCTPKEAAKEATKEKTYFRVGYIFDLSQVDKIA